MNAFRLSLFILFGALQLLSFGQTATNAPVTYILDLSKSHTFADFEKSGLPYKEQSGRAAGSGRRLNFWNVDVQVKLPAGRVLKQVVRDGTLDFDENGLQRLELIGEAIMPTDEAYEVMKRYHLNFGLGLEQLDEWHEKNKKLGADIVSFGMQTPKFYPGIGVGIIPSINRVYPCTIMLVVSWISISQSGWNEERAEREISPSTNTGILSCEPPSGKMYTRKEAYAPLRKANEEYQRKYLLENPTNCSPGQFFPSGSTNTTASQAHSEKAGSSLNLKLISIIGLLTICFAIFMFLKVKRA